MTLLLTVILVALVFEYINGFHDTANAIATSVSTRALSVKAAIIMAATLNFVGAMAFTKVAKTIGTGMQRLAMRLEKVPPDVRQRFAELTEQVNQRAARSTPTASRPAERPESETSPEDVPLTAARNREAEERDVK